MLFRSTIRNQMLFLLGLALATAPTAHASVGQSVHVVRPYPSRIALAANPQTAASGATVVLAATLTRTSNPCRAYWGGDIHAHSGRRGFRDHGYSAG